MRNLKTTPSPNQNQILRNRKYVRKLKAQEDAKLLHQSSSSNRSFEDELDEYSSKRLSMEQPSTSSTALQLSAQSQEKSANSVICIPDDDSELEEGEIVESEVSQCVDLIEESFNALQVARRITDLSPIKQPLFFEDRRTDESRRELPPPIYNTLGESDDVIVLDATVNTTATDDSVIFVSEEENTTKPLQKPKVLLTPAIDELMKLSGVKLTPLSTKSDAKTLSPGQAKRRERFAKWRLHKQMEYAKREVEETVQGKPKKSKKPSPLKASTSRAKQVTKSPTIAGTSRAQATPSAGSKQATPSAQQVTSSPNGEKKKRIILIDGSNIAITHAKSKLGRGYDEKSPNAFSVEGRAFGF